MLVKILNSLYDKSKAHDAMGLEELCVLFYINENQGQLVWKDAASVMVMLILIQK